MSSERFWRGRRVLVTGGTGFLGTWLVKALLERGAVVTALAPRRNRGVFFAEKLDRKAAFVPGAVTDEAALERLLKKRRIETVFHLAAQPLVGVANRDPLSTFEINIRGTWCLLEACRRSPFIGRVIVASTDRVYGQQGARPCREDAPLLGRHPYAVSKNCADLLARTYFVTYKLPVCVTRLSNLFGGGDLNRSRIVPDTVLALRDGRRPVIRSDGRFIRDYIYVEDAVEAYLSLAEAARRKGVAGESFNFSSQRPLSVLALVRRIQEATGRADLKPVILNRASSEIRRLTLDSGKARRLLGWRPAVGLDEGLRRTVAWYAARVSGR